jgi:hypothetical protein
MHKFALENIKAIRGKQEFSKIIIDGKCPFDEFEEKLVNNPKLTRELGSLYQYMEFHANGVLLPKEKFRKLKGSKGPVAEYEFKTKNLRVYIIRKPGGKIIIIGGTKNNQKKDLVRFRSIKQNYLEATA